MARSSWRAASPRRRCPECSGAVRPCRRVAATRGGCPPDPGADSDPDPDSESDPDTDPDAVPARGRSRPGGRAVLDRHRRQRELRTRDVVPGRGRRERHRQAVRVRDPQRRASRRHPEGDLPASPEAGDGLLDLDEPGPGRGDRCSRRPTHHWRASSTSSRASMERRGGLVEAVGGVQHANRRRGACFAFLRSRPIIPCEACTRSGRILRCRRRPVRARRPGRPRVGVRARCRCGRGCRRWVRARGGRGRRRSVRA